MIAAASWFVNMGWIRFALTFLLVPFLHVIIFFVTNLFAASYLERSKTMKWLQIGFCLTYLAIHLLLPDAGDIGSMYFFFGLIRNDVLSDIAFYLAEFAFWIHAALFIWQIILMIKLKRADRYAATQ